MRYKATHTYIIDFEKCDHRKLFAELELFEDGWPNVKVGNTVVSLSHQDRWVAMGASDMLYSRLRQMEWFHE